MISAGRLNHKLEFKKPIDKKDGSGGSYVDYETDFECWGNVKANAGQQVFQSARYEEKVDGLIIIRHQQNVNADYRVIDKMADSTYEIKGAYDPDGSREVLHILFTEVT